MTNEELLSIKQGFDRLNEKIADLQAQFAEMKFRNVKEEKENKLDEDEEKLNVLRKQDGEEDKSAIIKSWWDKPLI